jgi:hypothetical protein
MANALGVPLFSVLSSHTGAMRYLESSFETLAFLRRTRPQVVVCQNPSIVLTVVLLAASAILRYRLVVDAHFGGVESWTGSRVVQGILDQINRLVTLVIVTNESHARHVRSLGGRAFVCPDPLPDLQGYLDSAAAGQPTVFFISSFDLDEPTEEILRAAELLAAEGFRPMVSGDFRRAGVSPAAHPQMEFLGFAPEEVFYRRLASSAVVVDLTKHDNCLVCGAYEAMAARRPLVLSRHPALEAHFSEGTIFTENRAESIAAAVIRAYSEREALAGAADRWVNRAHEDTNKRISELSLLLQGV